MKSRSTKAILGGFSLILVGVFGYLWYDSIKKRKDKEKKENIKKEDLESDQPKEIKKKPAKKEKAIEIEEFSSAGIQQGFQLIARKIIEEDCEKNAIKSFEDFWEMFVRKASITYMLNEEALDRIPKNKEEMIDFMLSSGLQQELIDRKICHQNKKKKEET